MELGILFLGLVLVLVCIVFLAVFGMLAVSFLLGSIVVSRLSMAALVGGLMAQEHMLVQGGFWNFLLWTAICFGVIYLLSALMPKVNFAIKAGCTTMIAILITLILTGLGAALLGPLLGGTGALEDLPWWFEVLLKIVCMGFIYSALAQEAQESTVTTAIALRGPVFAMIGRGLASLIYGISGVFLLMPTMGGWPYSETAAIVVFILFTVGSFVGDYFLFDQNQ